MKEFDVWSLPVRPAMTEEQLAAEAAARKAAEDRRQKNMAMALLAIVGGFLVGAAIMFLVK